MTITAPTDCSATQCCVVLYTEVMHCATHDTRPGDLRPQASPDRPDRPAMCNHLRTFVSFLRTL